MRCKKIIERFNKVNEGSDHTSKLFSPKIISKYEITNPTSFAQVMSVLSFGELMIEIADDNDQYNKLFIVYGDTDRSVGAVASDLATLRLGEKPTINRKSIKDLTSSMDKGDDKFLMKLIKDVDKDFQDRLVIKSDKKDEMFQWYSKVVNTERKYKPMSLTTKEYYSTIEMAKERLANGEFYSIQIGE